MRNSFRSISLPLLSEAQAPSGHACRTAEEDEQDGRDADARQRKARHRQKDGQEDAGRKEGVVERLQHPHTGREDEIDDADLNAFEGVGNDSELGELLKKQRDGVDDEKGRQADGHGGGRRAGDSGQLVAEVGGAVDGHRAGGGFRDGGHVEELVLIQPPAALDKFLFQQGDHSVAAAEGECADP